MRQGNFYGAGKTFFFLPANYPIFKRFNEITIIYNRKIQSFGSTLAQRCVVCHFSHENRIMNIIKFAFENLINQIERLHARQTKTINAMWGKHFFLLEKDNARSLPYNQNIV